MCSKIVRMEAVLLKVVSFIEKEDEYSSLMQWVATAFKHVKRELASRKVSNEVLDTHIELFSEKLADTEWVLNQGHVSFSNTLCMSSPCVIFLLILKLRLLRNDNDWFIQDAELRKDPEKLKEDSWVNARLDFCKYNLPYYETNPMMFYTMSQVQKSLIAFSLISLDPKVEIDFNFLNDFMQVLIDRISILVSYPYPPEINDVDDYVHEISETVMVPSSAFVWDMFSIVTDNNRRLAESVRFSQLQSASDFDDYDDYLKETSPHVELWFANMIVIAAGDDLNTIFRDYYLEHHVEKYENAWYSRHNAGQDMSSYKILQFCRGFEDANSILITATQLVATLIYIEDGKSQVETVLTRLKNLSSFEYNILFRCIIQYTVLRSWEIDFDIHVFASLLSEKDPLMPHISAVPFVDKYVVDHKTVCWSFKDAFTIWCYILKSRFKATVYNRENKEPVSAAKLIDGILTYTQKIQTR